MTQDKNFKAFLYSFLLTLICSVWASVHTEAFAAQKNIEPVFFDGADTEEGLQVLDQAKERIERIRKDDFTIKFIHPDNTPVKGKAEIKMIRHGFPFGAAIIPTLRLKDGNPAKSVAVAVCKELFSRVTVNNFWSSQPQRHGKHNFRLFSLAEAFIPYAIDNNFDIRFHALIYIRKNFAPHWAKEVKTTEEWWPLIEQRIQEVAKAFNGRIAVVDVINEISYHKKWREKNISNFPDQYDPMVVDRIFRIARKYFPNTKLIILDQYFPTLYSGNRRFQKYYGFYKRLIELKTPFDGIGIQAHFYTRKSSFQAGSKEGGPDTFRMKEIDSAFDYLSGLGKPIYITEFSPPSRNKKIKRAQARLTDEEVAAWTVNFYTLAFSKPYIKEIVRWFLVDEIGGRGMDAGLVDKKGKLKPAYYSLRKLLKETWSTEWEGTLQNGEIKFRGFFGEYKATINGKEVYFKLTHGGNREVLLLVDDI